jgi:PAT family beta-lactamase induction signal transducer AmpG
MKLPLYLRNPRYLVVLYLGFASGLPLPLTAGTLSLWLYEAGINIKSIGLFTLVGLPYALKFLWAPLNDAIHLPFLNALLGRRRSWLLLNQAAIAATLIYMTTLSPATEILAFAIGAFLLSFFSASQDIVSDAYRIELLKQEDYAPAAAIHVLGYRLAMLFSGAGALYMTKVWSWPEIYFVLAIIMLFCALVVVFLPNEFNAEVPFTKKEKKSIAGFFHHSV